MSETPNPEATPSPEALAVRALDATAERVFSEYDVQPVPEWFRPEEGAGTTREQVHSDQAGDSLTRMVAEDGTVTYKYSQLWYASPDRGSFENSWQKDGTALSSVTVSELKGKSPAVEGTADNMAALLGNLEKAFPSKAEQQAAQISTRGLRRFFRRRR